MTKISVLDRIPHRPPFLFVDEVVDYSPEKELIFCSKRFREDEFFFQGHFPGSPVVPGVLLSEGMAQSAALHYALKWDLKLGLQFEKNPDFKAVFLLSHMKVMKFKRPVLPGQTVFFEVLYLRQKASFSWYEGKVHLDDLNGPICCEGSLTAFLDSTSQSSS